MRGRLLFVLSVALALTGLGVSYWAIFLRPEERAEPARATASETLRFTEVVGRVEVAGPGGAWRAAERDATVAEHDRIRTADDASAALRTAGGATIRLSGGTEAEVAALRRELERLSLGAGMVEADVPADPARVFQIDLDHEGGAARTRGARFTVSANGAGSAAVAAHRGEVTLSARGREVVIHDGQLGRLRPGAPPDAPQPIPDSLFLKVVWPTPLVRSKRVFVSGQTSPGARVRVGGRYVRVDADGAYRTELELPDGAHQLAVEAVDVAGHVTDEKSPRIVVDTRTDFTVRPPRWK